jgi:hypothetical protein
MKANRSPETDASRNEERVFTPPRSRRSTHATANPRLHRARLWGRVITERIGSVAQESTGLPVFDQVRLDEVVAPAIQLPQLHLDSVQVATKPIDDQAGLLQLYLDCL